MKLVYRCALAIAVSFLFAPASLFASSLAIDSASDPAYNGGWTTGSNGGVGWGSSWTNYIGSTVSNTPSTHFIGSSTNTGGNGAIDTSGKSWGLQGNGQGVYAERGFNGPMTNGQRFVISMDNGYVPSNSSNPEVGFFLKNDLQENRLQFILTGVTNIYNDGALTGITNTDQGLRIVVEMVNIDTAKVSVTTLADGITHVFSNILMNAGVSNGHHQVTNFVLENVSTGGGLTNQAFFNSIYLLPDTNDSSFFADQSLGMAASSNPALVNSNLTYTITVTNKGPAAATGMTVTDVPPSGVTFVSATSAQGACTTDAFGRVVCSIGSLASNGVASIALVVTPLATGVITNTVSVSALNVDPNPGDNALTSILSVVTSSQLSVTPASFPFGTVATGTTHQTSFVVTNLGGTTLTGSATVSTVSFAVASGSPFSVAGFGSTNVGVSFTPSSTGSFTDKVIFASNGGVSTNTVTGAGAVVPAASFGADHTSGLVPLIVTFTDTSTGTITNRFWDFGDNVTTNTVNPSMGHTYNSTGTYTVALIVSGPLGADTDTQPGYITVTNIPPQLTVTPASQDFGLLPVGQTSTQTFSVINGGVDTLSGTATVSGAQFALVGGSPYSVPGGQTGFVAVSFGPNSAGSFTGSVVFASNGGVSTNAITGSAAIAPVAGFTASPTNGAVSLNVNFTDTSTGTITNYLWTFGDSGTSTLSSPTHTYTNAGTFSVSLTVVGPLGSSTNTQSNLITVTNAPPVITVTNAPPVASFTASVTNGAAPLNVTFTDASTGTITNHSWTFGDGGTSTSSSPSHTYTNAGLFSVALTVSGPGGSSTTNRVNLITVTNAPPVASFTASVTNGAAPLNVTFTDASTGTITNHSWT
ncbi:MAG: PKD domain-containing protein, partial [Verrucomicrobiia bacterium]